MRLLAFGTVGCLLIACDSNTGQENNGAGSGGAAPAVGGTGGTLVSGGTPSSSGGSVAATGSGTATGGVSSLGSGGSSSAGKPASGGSISSGGVGFTSGGAAPTSGTGGVVQTGGAGGATGGAHCTDGLKNTDETGVDCGGASCPSCEPAYKVSPPNSCQNQYYYENCKPGDPSSECGGICQPRNACENAPNKDGTVGFACSRFMLFSPLMIQAAKDDARANSWQNPDDPPFLYGVVGHDTNSGGIDKGMVGTEPCCECYQLIFDKPYNEYDPSTPPPKPMIVQAFNIGATTESFDIYMGAGGLGAFNACYNLNSSSTTGGSFLFETYPTDGQPNDGGVKFLRHDECKDASAWGEATKTSITSAGCQDKIASLCNQASSSKSAALTSTTRDSCIQGNRFESLYHQNWAVYAKRVTCPDNLTRVTGCKLAPETGLPKVDASVTTAAQATSAGFLSGYHTTTMQDCCKPACAAVEHVAGKIAHKNSVAPWTSFYTCDINDQPLTEE